MDIHRLSVGILILTNQSGTSVAIGRLWRCIRFKDLATKWGYRRGYQSGPVMAIWILRWLLVQVDRLAIDLL